MDEVEKYVQSFEYVLPEPRYEIRSSAFSYDGEVFVTSSGDNTYRVHTLTNPDRPSLLKSTAYGSGLIKYTHHPHVVLTTFSNKNLLNSVGQLCFETKEFIHIFHGHTDEILGIDQNNIDDTFISSGFDSRVLQWDTRCPDLPNSDVFFTGFKPIVSFSNDGTSIFVVLGNTLNVFDRRRLSLQQTSFFNLPHNESAYMKIAVAIDGNSVAVSDTKGKVSLITNMSTPQNIVTKEIATNQLNDAPEIAFTPDSSRLLFSNGVDGSVCSMLLKTYAISQFSNSHEALVNSIVCNFKFPLVSTSSSIVKWWTPQDTD
ncbi:WD repeat-containing protein, putative [Entamoeba invadens IP1]|uniref:WD repeat-containing protein, putative n=1 Tax=Entamoeba invadens IP1 TaxID=370355 RepID=A0A0A1U3A2_ENTIV|nr:WD repeat-containing protein, putative [Entamoeba invadens IP1]ELP86091.1 WD repeat-containing protein, putative [Entamoeba invadens IP1]|eukprot:XP_004185437.1 WD repeat-containing protein, putative [Entamoeba invadens IP1]